MTEAEITRLQTYLQKTFANKALTVQARKETNDSVEVHLNGEFIGVIYRDDDEGDVSYDFNMAILEMDLPAVA
ncbi:MAG: DUF3126 family protein [Alphaproteobacteria bacterium]|nr:DUF3126 family protein [Alphaproteobacteria bacterium]